MTVSSLGQMVQFLKSKLYVQKWFHDYCYFGCDKRSTMLISIKWFITVIYLILSGQTTQYKKYTCIYNVMSTSGLE